MTDRRCRAIVNTSSAAINPWTWRTRSSASAAPARRPGSAAARPRHLGPAVPPGQGAEPSVLEPFVGPRRFDTHRQRVVEGRRLMQAASDVFLGWLPRSAPRPHSEAAVLPACWAAFRKRECPADHRGNPTPTTRAPDSEHRSVQLVSTGPTLRRGYRRARSLPRVVRLATGAAGL
jgi:hypothetical protein